MSVLFRAVFLLFIASSLFSTGCASTETMHDVRMKGIHLPPASVIDCYNLLSAQYAIMGKITLVKGVPAISDDSCFEGKVLLYLPDKNIISCWYTVPCADPMPSTKASVMMTKSADKRIFVALRYSSTEDFSNNRDNTTFYVYKNRELVLTDQKKVPGDVLKALFPLQRIPAQPYRY